MRYTFFLVTILVVASSCSTMKSSSSSSTVQQPVKRSASPEFIDNIAIRPSTGKGTGDPLPANGQTVNATSNLADRSTIEFISPLLLKYAILMNVTVEELSNEKLIGFIDDWYGTRYKLGGADKSGVDCSAFVQSFMLNLYDLQVPRTAREQYLQSHRIKKNNLSEGDLVFFRTKKKNKSVSHVGVYLRNNKFIHASTSGGVMISDLDDEYFRLRYAGAGRMKD